MTAFYGTLDRETVQQLARDLDPYVHGVSLLLDEHVHVAMVFNAGTQIAQIACHTPVSGLSDRALDQYQELRREVQRWNKGGYFDLVARAREICRQEPEPEQAAAVSIPISTDQEPYSDAEMRAGLPADQGGAS